jgi:glycosyltransferase involved in cell wall biosynthesis
MHISVVVPVYNARSYLSEVLESICTQRDVDFEVVVVNDGSTDDSEEVAWSVFRRWPDIPVQVINQENMGEASAVNRGVHAARGDLIVIVNADDPLLPDHLVTMSESLGIHHDAVVAYCDWMMIDKSGREICVRTTRDFSDRLLYDDFVCLPGPGAVIRKSALLRDYLRDANYKFISDYEAWLFLLTQGRFLRVPRVLATWRMHAGGATAQANGLKISSEIVRLSSAVAELPVQLMPSGRRISTRSMRSHALYYAALQGLHGRGVPSKRHRVKSLLIKPWPSIGRNRQHRSVLAAFLVLLLPFSRLPYRYWRSSKYTTGRD